MILYDSGKGGKHIIVAFMFTEVLPKVMDKTGMKKHTLGGLYCKVYKAGI